MPREIDKQQENINQLLELIKENPTLPILPMIDGDIVGSDDYGYWTGSWGKSTIDEYYISDETVYFKSNDYDKLLEEFSDNNYKDYQNLNDDEFDKIATKYVDEYEWTKAIIIKINAM